MNSHNIKISKASNTIGAIIEGVKLNEELSKDTIQEIYNAFLKYQVIFFKNQNLTKNEYLSFATKIGKPIKYPFVKGI